MANREELVEKMLGAYWQDLRPCEECKFGDRGGMDAALSVAVEELLQPLQRISPGISEGPFFAENLLAARRAIYLKPKSVEDKIGEIVNRHVNADHYIVAPERMRDEIIGLIQQLKEQPK